MQSEISQISEKSLDFKISILNFVNKHCRDRSGMANQSKDLEIIQDDTFPESHMTYTYSQFNFWLHRIKFRGNESIRHKLPVELGSYLPGFTGKLCLWNQSYNLPVNVGKCPKWLVNYDCDFRVVIYQWNWANFDLVTLKVQSWLVNFVFEIRGTIYQ